MTDTRDAIVRAFQASRFQWRTAQGLAKDAGLPREQVRAFLESSDEVKKINKLNSSGTKMYALRTSVAVEGSGGQLVADGKAIKCLVLLPKHSTLVSLHAAIDRVLKRHAVQLVAFEDRIDAGALWVDGIMASLRASDFVIADLSERNPNVLFELGIAHGIGKPFVLIVNVDAQDGGIPADLLGYQYIAYDLDEPQRFETRLNSFVQSLATRLERAR